MTESDWMIVKARDLKPGDRVRPMNARGPITPVLSVHTNHFKVDPSSQEEDLSLTLPFKEIDAYQPRSGWVPLQIRTETPHELDAA
jgi:hypothetical protein